MRVWVVALLTLVAAMAGCLDGSSVADILTDPDEEESTDGTSADTAQDIQDVVEDGTEAPGPEAVLQAVAPNAAPAASLSVSSTLGQAPMFTILSFSAFDPDGDALSWSLDVDGDGTPDATGTELPGSFEHTFLTARAYTASFTVTDGATSVTERVVIQVGSTAAEESVSTTACPPCIVLVPDAEGGGFTFTPDLFEDPVPQPPPVPNLLDFIGTVLMFCEICTEEGGPGVSLSWNVGEQGFDTVWVDLPGEAIGRPFIVTSSGIPFTDPDVAFMSSCSSDATVVGTAFNEGPEIGVVPAGAGCLVAWEWVGNPGTVITVAVV